MYSRQRKARVFFGLSDIFLISLAFEAAYRTRTLLHLERAFYMSAERKALVLGMSLAAWVAIALWLEVYDKLDSGHPTVILRDTMRQCGYGALAVVLMEYALRLDLSRPFLLLFSGVCLGAAAAFPADRRAHGGGDPPGVRRAALRDGGGDRRTGHAAGARGSSNRRSTACGCAVF